MFGDPLPKTLVKVRRAYYDRNYPLFIAVNQSLHYFQSLGTAQLDWTVRPLFDPFPLSAESDSPADSKVNVVLTCESSIDT